MKSKTIMTCLATTFVYIGLEAFLHSGLLSGIYHQTAQLWRPESEMKNFIPGLMLGEAMFGLFFGLIYTKGYEAGKGTIVQGLRYGLLMALMIGPISGLMWYAVLPIPQVLAVYWMIGAFVEMIILGLVAGAIYKE